MDAPDDIPHGLRRAFDAWWYRRSYPLRGPRRESLRRARSLTMAERGGPEGPLDASSLLSSDPGARGSTRFLGVYGADGVLAALRAYGILDGLAGRGFHRVGVELDLRDPFEHAARVYDGDPSRRLGELVAARRHVQSLGPVQFTEDREVLAVCWLAIEDPDAPTGSAPTRLPGQERPGVGMFRAVMDMALAGASHLGFAAMLAVPAHYHLAWMYHPWFRPLDPEDEGTLLALRHATRSRSRRDASWAIARGEVRAEGSAWHWKAPTVCAPFDAAVREWMTSAEYARAAVSSAEAQRDRFVYEPSG